MNFFYLVRHGDKNKTKGDPSLSVLGKKQAQSTANYLKKFPATGIYTSPLKRCRDTAEVIAKTLKLSVNTKEDLRERINWGDDPSLSFEEFLKLWEKTSMNRGWKPKFGDSSRNTGKRLEKTLKEISNHKKNLHIILITSGGIITDFLRNVFSEDYLRKFKFDFLEEREKHIKECSITIIKELDNKFELIELASVKHLPFPVE
jgi:broad specificity phosphatase PhoE